jgi:hypothetical protein
LRVTKPPELRTEHERDHMPLDIRAIFSDISRQINESRRSDPNSSNPGTGAPQRPVLI